MSETDFYKTRIKELEEEKEILTIQAQPPYMLISQREFIVRLQRIMYKIGRYKTRLKEMEINSK